MTLTDDQILLADILMTPLTLSNNVYLFNYYSSIGSVISQTRGGDPDTVVMLTQLAINTHVNNLIEFLVEKGYIETGHHEGQFKLTPLGLKVKNAGGHQKYLDHIRALEKQEQDAATFRRDREIRENRNLANRIKRFANTPLGSALLGAIIGGLVVAFVIAHFHLFQIPPEQVKP